MSSREVTTRAAAGDTVVVDASSQEPTGWQITPHGKGRVHPRSCKNSMSQPALLQLAATSEWEKQQGVRDGDLMARYPAQMVSGWLPRLQVDTTNQVYQAMQEMRGSQPVVLCGTPLAAGLGVSWTSAHLGNILGTDRCQLRCSDTKRNVFYEADSLKNEYGSFYHIRESETQVVQTSLKDAVACMMSWTSRHTYLKHRLMQWVPGGADQSMKGHLEAACTSPTLQQEMDSGIDWRWLQGLMMAQGHGGVMSLDLELGNRNGLLPARYVPHDRLLVQVTGRRRVLLLNPQQAFEGLYPFPLHHTYDGYSMVDFEGARHLSFPMFDNVRGSSCILSPGDILYVPQYWFVHIQELEDGTVGLAFAMNSGQHGRSQDQVALQVSRVLEERLADEEGVSSVRKWLQIIGFGEEGEWTDVETVKGYRRCVFCHEIREEVDLNLGEPGRWADLLPAMCNSRLMPTTWLNQNFREPLYLTDKLVQLKDTRSEEERKYPELFRAKLAAEGWSVPDNVSTVPIPGYNTPAGWGGSRR